MKDVRNKRALSPVIAILIVIAVIFAATIFLINYATTHGSLAHCEFSIESAQLLSDYTGTKPVFTITLKNTGNEPIVTVAITVDDEDTAVFDLSDHPVDPGATIGLTPELHNKYMIGNVYTFSVYIVSSSGATFSRSFTIRCQGYAGAPPS